jgi:hypothetical protein
VLGLPDPPEDLSLENASDTDEIFRLADDLAWWAMRRGMDPADVVDWVLDQPREAKLPRGSRGLNPTEHHVRSGAQKAADNWIGGLKPSFDPDPLHELAARVSGSGVTHERYLLGAIALCFEKQTVTPVITGPLLARVTGVSEASAGEVLRKWSDTWAYGFFTGVTFSGERGHGRVWAVDPGWIPTSKPKRHLPGCSRSGGRCKCTMAHSAISISAAVEDRSGKVRHFEAWVTSLKSGAAVTSTDVCKALGVTRAVSTRLLKAAEGSILKTGTFEGGRVRKRGPDGKYRYVSQGQTWFTA